MIYCRLLLPHSKCLNLSLVDIGQKPKAEVLGLISPTKRTNSKSMAVAPIKVIKQRHINEIWREKKIKICFSYADFVFSALYIFRRSYSNNCSDGSFPWKTKIFWETWNRSRWAVQPLCYIFTKSILHFDQLSLAGLSLPKIFWETWNRSRWAV